MIRSKSVLVLPLTLLWVQLASSTDVPSTTLDSLRQTSIAAMQRIRLNLPEPPDSPALEAYAIHDYLVAARFRRDLMKKSDDALDTAIDGFLRAHVGQPVARSLRRDWFLILFQRRRW